MKGLIIKDPWCEMILKGEKTLELRGGNTKIRGTINIIKSGTGEIFGTVDLVDCIKLSDDDFYANVHKHQVDSDRDSLNYSTLHGWVFKNPVRWLQPVPYNHKQGCVIWINL